MNESQHTTTSPPEQKVSKLKIELIELRHHLTTLEDLVNGIEAMTDLPSLQGDHRTTKAMDDVLDALVHISDAYVCLNRGLEPAIDEVS